MEEQKENKNEIVEEPKQEEAKQEEKKEEPKQEEKKEEPKQEEPKNEEPKKKEPKKNPKQQFFPDLAAEQKPEQQKENKAQKEDTEKQAKEEQQKKKQDEKNRIISAIKEKIKELNTHYTFSLQYHDLIQKILTNLEEQTYEKINNSLNDCFGYLHFFKDSSDLYSKFAEQIQNSNKLITFTEKKPKMNDDFLSTVMQSTQNIFYQNLSKFSNGLKNNIINKGPLSKLQEKKNQIDVIRKTHLKKYSDLIDEKKKVEKKFKTYFGLFSSFVPELADQYSPPNKKIQPTPMPELIDAPDFVYVIKDFLDALNSLMTKINSFALESKESMKTINGIFAEVNTLIRESITIYMGESKIFFNSDVTKKFEEIEAYFKKYEENAKENNIFKLAKIFHNEQAKQTILTLLQQYYTLLSNSNLVKKELIADKSTFSIEKYTNIELFFNWFISVLPKNFEVTVNDLIIKKFEIKRDPGVFQKWKAANMIFTKQHHLILYDQVDSYKIDDIVRIFETDKINFRRKDDKKKGFLFEVIAVVKGKIMNFKGDFLFDALGEPNLNAIKELIDNQA